MKALKGLAAGLAIAFAAALVGTFISGAARGMLRGLENSEQPIAAIVGLVGLVLVFALAVVYSVRWWRRSRERRARGQPRFEESDRYTLAAGLIVVAVIAAGFVAQRLFG